MMNQEPVYLTAKGRRKLEEELVHLKEVRRPAVALMIKEAKEAGDISENAAYDEAKEQQALLEARIRHVEATLHNSEIIEADPDTSVVSLGTTVTVAQNGGQPESFQLVGTAEAHPGRGRISNASPLGKALLGKAVGETAEFTTPVGDRVEYEILAIK